MSGDGHIDDTDEYVSGLRRHFALYRAYRASGQSADGISRLLDAPIFFSCAFLGAQHRNRSGCCRLDRAI